MRPLSSFYVTTLGMAIIFVVFSEAQEMVVLAIKLFFIMRYILSFNEILTIRFGSNFLSLTCILGVNSCGTLFYNFWFFPKLVKRRWQCSPRLCVIFKYFLFTYFCFEELVTFPAISCLSQNYFCVSFFFMKGNVIFLWNILHVYLS